MRWMMFMRILVIAIQSEKEKKYFFFDDMVADMRANKKFQSIIKELFIGCRKLNISLVFITQIYFSVPKDVRLNSTHFLIMKINSRIELKTIAINHSADINYQDFKKIYRECTKEPYNCLTIDTTLPASDPISFRNIYLILIKMTIADQINILDRKIMQNEAQYNLDRKAARISALTSNNLDKYEYLTGEDLDLKPTTVKQAKFEYSPLGEISNMGLDKEEKDKKEGLFKRLKNIEDKNEKLLEAKNKTESIKEITDFVDKPLSLEAKELNEKIRAIQKMLITEN